MDRSLISDYKTRRGFVCCGRRRNKLWVIKTSLVQWDYSLHFVNKRPCELVIIISIHIAACVVKYYYYCCCCFYFILLHNRGKGLPRVTMSCYHGYHVLYVQYPVYRMLNGNNSNKRKVRKQGFVHSGRKRTWLCIDIRFCLMCTDLITLSLICNVQTWVVDSRAQKSCAWNHEVFIAAARHT